MISGTLDRSMVATFATSIVQVAKKPRDAPAGESCTYITQKPPFAIIIELVSSFDPAAGEEHACPITSLYFFTILKL